MADVGAFEKDTTYRLLVEAVRHWLLARVLARKSLPSEPAVFWIYASRHPGRNSIDWGDAAGPPDPVNKPLRGKRIRVTIEIETAG